MVKRKTKKKRRIPKTWIVADKGSFTKSIQHPKTGKMLGRRKIRGREKSDLTHVRRVSKGKYSGIILGRTQAIPIKASSKRRGTTRTIRRRL